MVCNRIAVMFAVTKKKPKERTGKNHSSLICLKIHAMTFLYDIAVFLYHKVILLVSPFNRKAALFISGRKHGLKTLRDQTNPSARYVWIHCASLGEFEQGRPLIEAIKEEHPELSVVLSFFSPSGYEIRKSYPLADIVCYLPADTKRNAIRFIETIHPEMAVFVKYEFWYHYLEQLKEKKIPVFLVSGIFRKDQRFFSGMPWGKWFRKELEAFTHLFVQDAGSAALLAGIGLDCCTVAGDTRFDRVATITNSSQSLPVVDKFSGGKPLLIAGSTWKPDEELLVPVIREEKRLKYIIVPHEVSPVPMNRLAGMFITPPVFFSEAEGKNLEKYDVMIVDTVGILSSLYRYGRFAYIGGGFGKGIHNILEAATFGLPVFFGPNYRKFREACQLTGAGGAFPVTSSGHFRQVLSRLLEDEKMREQVSRVAFDYVNQNRGATRIILNKIFS